MKICFKRPIRFFYCIVIFTLVGCSSSPNLNLLHNGDHVAIVSPVITENDKPFSIQNLAVGGDAKTGAGSGALAGAAIGLTCGPWAIICSPLGALTGVIVGGVGGAAVGAVRGLDSEQVESVKNKMISFLETHNPQEELLAKVIERGEKRWQIVSTSDEKEILVQLSLLDLRIQADGSVMLAMQATVTVHISDQAGKKQILSQKFEYESSPIYVDSWTEDNENFLPERFSDAYNTLTENIITALSYR